jgi:hypothetical protein
MNTFIDIHFNHGGGRSCWWSGGGARPECNRDSPTGPSQTRSQCGYDTAECIAAVAQLCVPSVSRLVQSIVTDHLRRNLRLPSARRSGCKGGWNKWATVAIRWGHAFALNKEGRNAEWASLAMLSLQNKNRAAVLNRGDPSSLFATYFGNGRFRRATHRSRWFCRTSRQIRQ